MRSVALAAALNLAAAACGDGSGPAGEGPVQRPSGPHDVVVQVVVHGGLAFGPTLPERTVLGDGTVITEAPVAAIYPGPAITPLQSVRVPAERVDGLVELAGRLRLLHGPLEFGQPPGADASDTTVVISAGGRVHRHVVNDLGGHLVESADPGDMSKEELANRRAVRRFVAAVEELPPGEEPWEPSSVAITVLGPYEPERDLPQQPREWPLPVPPPTSDGRRCTVVRGEHAHLLLEALRSANSATPWVIEGAAYSVSFVPVVPGHDPCTD